MKQGFRRRILIEPVSGQVTASLEDDYHRMVVSLHHRDGIATRVASEMPRSPWTLCPGAMEQLATTFTGLALTDFARRGAKKQNCTHLHDLAVFGAAHADETTPLAYDILVTDPVDGVREAQLTCNGTDILGWTLAADRFLAPVELVGLSFGTMNNWIAAQTPETAEAARMLRWAAMIAYGRDMLILAGSSAMMFAAGACYNFQPERAVASVRRNGASIDFSLQDAQPLSDRADAFPARLASGDPE